MEADFGSASRITVDVISSLPAPARGRISSAWAMRRGAGAERSAVHCTGDDGWIGVDACRQGERCEKAFPPSGEEVLPFDDARFSGIVRPFIGQLVKVARRILGREDLAWEAVQEALLSLWLRDPPPPNPRAWLIRAVILRSLQLGRSIRRRRKHEAKACRERAEASDRDDPARLVLTAEIREELRAALSRLGPSHRDVLSLHLIEELDYESIARRLAIPIGTVRSRLNRARHELRGVLGPPTRD